MMRAVRENGRSIEYELIRTDRQSMEMRMDTQGGLRVFAPKYARLSLADDYVRRQADWIEDARRRMRAYLALRDERYPMTDGSSILLRGDLAVLRVRGGARTRVFERDGEIVVETAGEDANAVRCALRAYLIEQARAMIAQRLTVFIAQVGRGPKAVTVREQKTRWGSCSSVGNLNFNWKLIMAPPGALDYVVVHELCHLYELNHSPRFWALVERYMPDYRQWKSWLKDNGQKLGF